jgi:hypothetical protein
MLAVMESIDFEFARPVGSLRDPGTGEYLQVDALFRRSRLRSADTG